MVRPKKTPGPFNRQAFQFIGIAAAGMKAIARISLGRFGAKDRSLSFKYGSGRMIFSSDQVQGVFNSCFFEPDDFGNRGIVLEQILHP
jgi:hypothetical protein